MLLEMHLTVQLLETYKNKIKNQCNRFNFDFFFSYFFFTRNGKTKSYTGIQKIIMDLKSSECHARQYGDQILSYIIGKIQRNTPSKNNASTSIRQRHCVSTEQQPFKPTIPHNSKYILNSSVPINRSNRVIINLDIDIFYTTNVSLIQHSFTRK